MADVDCTSRLPNLVIAGVPRASTTSLFTYLSLHPDVSVSSNKETNFFLPEMFGEDRQPLGQYRNYFKQCDSRSRYWVEASPRYFYGKGVLASRIQSELDSPRIIVILRDPVDRLYSFFNHRKKMGKIDWEVSFNDHVEAALQFYNESVVPQLGDGVNPALLDVHDSGLVHGLYAHYISSWYEVFAENFRIFFYEELASDPKTFVTEVFDWLELDTTPVEDMELSAVNKSVEYKNRVLVDVGRFVNERILAKLGVLHKPIRNLLLHLNDSLNTTTEEPRGISPEVEEQLNSFYAQSNAELREYLVSKNYQRLPGWLLE